MRRVFVSNSQPIRFARFDNKSVNRGLPVLDQTRALDPCHRPEGSWALGTRMHDVMPSGRQREHAQYVTSLKIYFRPRLTAVASRILKGTLRIYDGDGKDDASEKCVYILLWNFGFIRNYPVCVPVLRLVLAEYATNAFNSK